MKPFLLLATRAEDDAADGEYAAMLDAAGLREHELLRIRLEASPMPPIDLDAVSGIIVGGSPFNSSDPADAKSAVQVRVETELAALLDAVVPRDFPFLGACYGVGTLGTHEGALIDRTFTEPIGPVTVTLTDAGTADPLLAGLPERFDAFVGHKEAVTTLPEHAVLLASSATCPVQMFRVGEHVYATQFHPELTVDGILERIRVYQGHGYFTSEEMPGLVANARAAQVEWPAKVLSNFVARYAS